MARRPPYGSTATAGTTVDAFTQNMISGSTNAPGGGRSQTVFPPLDRGPQAVHSSDLFFNNSSMYGRPNEMAPSPSNAPGPMSAQLYPYHQQAYRQQFSSPPPRPQPPPNPYIYGAPQSAYGQQQPVPWAPGSSPSIASPNNQQKRPQRPATASGAPPLHHSFSARPVAVHTPHTQPAFNNSTHVHRPPYRTQSLFGQVAPPPPAAPPLPTLPPMHSNPYIGHPPPPPSAAYNSPPTPYHVHANNPYAGSNTSPLLFSAEPSEGPFPPPPEPSPLPPKLVEEEDVPSSPESDPEELAMAIAISQNESTQRQLMEEKLINQEEEELARALAESLQASGSRPMISNAPYTSTFASSSKPSFQTSAIRVATSGFTLPSQDSLATPIARIPSSSTSTYSDDDFDFGFASYKKWQAPSTQGTTHAGASSSNPGPSTTPRPISTRPRSRPSSISSGSSLPYTLPSTENDSVERKNSLPKYIPTSARLSSSLAAMESLQQTETAESRLVFDDEAYARQLHNEEEQELAQLIERKARMENDREHQHDEKLPQYSTEGVLRPDSYSDGPSNAAGPSSSPSSQTSHSQSPPFPDTSYEFRPPINSVNSYSSSSSSASAQSSQSTSFQPQRPHSESVSSVGSSSSPQASTAGMLNPNHFVDRELLMGVSIGFRPPAILPKPVLMEDTMPNIISLPATRCPPLHLQAPDWQHLLRLMARLSNTRIEPTIESMAASKNEVKLRTVIQFIKPRANFNVWRTVLWFTIDHPIPEGKKFAQYHSGNPNLLPYSYVNEPLPVLLRDASDTNLSKTFTVPASEAVPLPTLPITFPNLALYLHAALQDSRRHSRSSEAASGLGKLGKMVQMCYPNVKELDNDDDFSGRSSSAVSGLFKRVIGRGNKDKRKGKNTNEETYQLVTPFVPDEWG